MKQYRVNKKNFKKMALFLSAISATDPDTLYSNVTNWALPEAYLTSTPYKQTDGTEITIESAYTRMSQDNNGYKDAAGNTDEDPNNADVRNPDYAGYSTANGINAEHWAFEAIVYHPQEEVYSLISDAVNLLQGLL